MIALANTRVTIYRTVPPTSTDSTETGFSRTVVASGIRALLVPSSARSGGFRGPSGSLSEYDLDTDPVSLQSEDIVKDESSGVEYVVDTVFNWVNTPIPHIEAGLSVMAP